MGELSAAQRSMRARMGGLATSARHDTKKLTEPARAAFDARFYEGIDPDLPEAERDRRATAARKAYFTKLAFASAKARKRGDRTTAGSL